MRNDGVWRPILGGCREDSRKGVLWPSRKQGHRYLHSDLKIIKLLFYRSSNFNFMLASLQKALTYIYSMTIT
jgi:hypothetical protein